MLTIIGGIIGLILRVLGAWVEVNSERKKQKQEALNVVKEGIVKRDPSAITAGFDAYRRVR